MSVAELPKFKIDPNSPLSAEEQSLRLHFKKNQPEKPDIDFPPYRFMPYPAAMYREWTEANRKLELRRIAGRLSLNLSNPIDFERADVELAEYESRQVGVRDVDDDGHVDQQLRDKNDADHRVLLGQGWADTPSGVKDAKDKQNKALALAAAHRNYEDRNMGELAKAEAEAIDDAADDHVPEIPQAAKNGRRKSEDK